MLETFCQKIGHPLNSEQLTLLEAYSDCLLKWNKTINLTAIQNKDQVKTHHFCDSLSVLPFLEGVKSLVDVGTGGGLPGIPLAIALPNLKVTLIETLEKKCHFLRFVVGSLKLSNVNVVNSRVEDYQPGFFFDVVITRAYSSLSQMLQQTTHLCDNGGRFLAMKGLVDSQELSEVPNGFSLEQQISLQVPGFSHRSLWIFKKGDV